MPSQSALGPLTHVVVFGGSVAALVLSCLSLMTGFGSVTIDPFASSSPSIQVDFEYQGLCISEVENPYSNDDGSGSSSDLPTTGQVCFRYRDVDVDTLARITPFGAHVFSLVSRELAGSEGAVLNALTFACAVSFAVVSGLYVLPALVRTLLCSRILYQPAPAAFSARVSVLGLAVGLVSSSAIAFLLSSKIADPTSWASRSTDLWSSYEVRVQRLQGNAPSFEGDGLSIPLGLYIVAPAALAAYFGWVYSFWTERGDEAHSRPSCVCCCDCCAGEAGGNSPVGCCGEEYLELDASECYRPCSYARRETSPTRVDASLVSCMRVSGMPCFLGVHIAAVVVGVLAILTPTLSLDAQVPVLNASEAYPSTSSTEFLWTIFQGRGCLSAVDPAFVGNGYELSDCFNVTHPRQLYLSSPAGDAAPSNADFSVQAMVPAAPLAMAVSLLVAFAAIWEGVVVLVVLCFLLCNVRRGRAASCFRCWGCLAAPVLGMSALLAVGSSYAAVAMSGRIGDIGLIRAYRRSLSAWNSGVFDVVDHTFPVSPPLETYNSSGVSAEVMDFSYDAGGTLVPFFALCCASAVVVLPLIVCVCCGVRNGKDADDAEAAGVARGASSRDVSTPVFAWLVRRRAAGDGGSKEPLMPRAGAQVATPAPAGTTPAAIGAAHPPGAAAGASASASAKANKPAPPPPPPSAPPSGAVHGSVGAWAPKLPPAPPAAPVGDGYSTPQMPSPAAPYAAPARAGSGHGIQMHGSMGPGEHGFGPSAPPAPTGPSPAASAGGGHGSDDDWMMRL